MRQNILMTLQFDFCTKRKNPIDHRCSGVKHFEQFSSVEKLADHDFIAEQLLDKLTHF